MYAMIKVLIVEDSVLVRERLLTMVSEIGGVEVIGQTGDPQNARVIIRSFHPDVVILDIRLPGGSGIDVLKEIKQEKEAPVVIVLTSFPYPQYRKECINAGAEFFFNKSTEFDKVSEVLKMLAEKRESQ